MGGFDGAAMVPPARSRWWVIAAHKVRRCLLAAERSEGKCGPGAPGITCTPRVGVSRREH